MGKPDPQTGHGDRRREKDESSQPHGEVARGRSEGSGEKRADLSGSATSFEESRRPADRASSFDRSGSAGDTAREPQNSGGSSSSADSDWGVAGAKSGLTRETKIGLLLILVLVCALGIVVYKKMQNQNEFPDDHESAATADHKSEHKKKVESIAPYGNGATVTHDTKTGLPNHGGVAPKQGEPPIGQDHHDDHSVPGGNPFKTASSTRNSGGSHTSIDEPRGKVSLSGGFPAQHDDSKRGNPFGTGTAGTGTAGSGAVTVSSPKTAGSWDLGQGQGQSSNGHDHAATAGGNPFGSGTTAGSGTTTHPGDGFRTAGKTSTVTSGPFDSHHTGIEKTKSEPRDGFAGSAASQDHQQPQTQAGHDAPRGVFGGDLGPGGSATTTNVSTTNGHSENLSHGSAKSQSIIHDGSDIRLGPYHLGTTRQGHSGSTTTVQTIGGDGNQPFGNSYDLSRHDGGTASSDHGSTKRNHRDGGAKITDHGTKFPRKQPGVFSPTPTPTPIDGRDIHYGNDRPRIHVVAHGDNYWTISRTAYGTGRYYIVLAEYNRHRIPNPKRMQPGMKVLIPNIGVLESRYPKICPRRVGKLAGNGRRRHLPSGFFRDRTGTPMFRVGKTDILSEIAQKHLGRSSRWIQIYHLNRQRIPNPNRLKIGTELRLPKDASNIRVVRTRRSYR